MGSKVKMVNIQLDQISSTSQMRIGNYFGNNPTSDFTFGEHYQPHLTPNMHHGQSDGPFVDQTLNSTA